MRPEEIFDKVLARVREFGCAGPAAMRFDVERTGGGTQRVGDLRSEYAAEFYLTAQRTLKAKWPRRWDVFVLFYYGGLPKREAVKIMRVPLGTFDYWAQKVRTEVGRALEDSELRSFHRYRERVRL